METLLFSVDVFIFMITVYGTLVAGGVVLRRRQLDELADDADIVTGESGADVLVGIAPPPTTLPPPHTGPYRAPGNHAGGGERTTAPIPGGQTALLRRKSSARLSVLSRDHAWARGVPRPIRCADIAQRIQRLCETF